MNILDPLYRVEHMTSEHQDWMRGIEFYNHELDVLEKRLSVLSLKTLDHEVKAQVEHFQNQFIIQHKNFTDIKKRIMEHERHMSFDIQHLSEHIANHTMAEHDKLRDDYFLLEKNVQFLKHEFYKYLAVQIARTSPETV
jgi:hypothetical protein